MVLLVSNPRSSLASVQWCALPGVEDGLCENCCAVGQQRRGWRRTFALQCRWVMLRGRAERSCSSAPAPFTLTCVPVAAFNFRQAFRDSVWQHSPKLIRVCGDCCFERFWRLPGILLLVRRAVDAGAPGFLVVFASLCGSGPGCSAHL